MKTNQRIVTDSRYTRHMNEIREVCKELDVVMCKPNYHCEKRDGGTVLLYTKEDHEFNKLLPEWASNSDYKHFFWCFEHTDRNGMIDFNFGNHGTLDLRGLNDVDELRKSILKAYIYIRECNSHA